MDDTPSRPTVFIVDDDEGGRKSLCYLIESIGIDVETYGSPLEFLDKFDGGRPGCLVLDVRMPQMGGSSSSRRSGNAGSTPRQS